MLNFAQSEIYFQRVSEPKANEIYFQFENNQGIPVMIIEGQYCAANGRLSNYWSWRNLKTGSRESGYGCFYKLKEIDNKD